MNVCPFKILRRRKGFTSHSRGFAAWGSWRAKYERAKIGVNGRLGGLKRE